ncbi:hypothetical protein [Rhodospirillum centenum]|uniref:hypothetical protein n=1 Tax=Rhodospirillum centenum TaxID=34018 RepID=UPI0011D14AB2|nr:hypothetical protein [Rhodospirillum centenum]
MQFYGIALMVAGVVLIALGLGMDASREVSTAYSSSLLELPHSVVNLHALFIKGALIWTGCTAFVAGAIFIAGDAVKKAILAGPAAETSPLDVSEKSSMIQNLKNARPPDSTFPNMSRYGDYSIYHHPSGRAWVRGRTFNSVGEARAWIDRGAPAA